MTLRISHFFVKILFSFDVMQLDMLFCFVCFFKDEDVFFIFPIFLLS